MDNAKGLTCMQSMAEACDKDFTIDNKTIEKMKITLSNQYNVIYKFLQEINQPYPGANYSN